MTARTLLILIFGAAGLFGVLQFVEQSQGPEVNSPQERHLFAGLDGERIAKILVEQGENKTEIAFEDGSWVIPSRENFPADIGQIRSLLLKVLDLRTSLVVTNDESAFEGLGVAVESPRGEGGLVTFFDAAKEELGSLFVGNMRKGSISPADSITTSGQYVRKKGEQSVYQVAEQIPVNAELVNWLDRSIASVLKRRVLSVEQFKGNDQVFLLERVGETPELKLAGNVPTDMREGIATISLLGAALENLRLDDVLSAESEDVKTLLFDQKTIFRLRDGLVYEINTAKKGEEYFLRIKTSLDEKRVEELKRAQAEYEKAVAAAELTSAEEGTAEEQTEEKRLGSEDAETTGEEAVGEEKPQKVELKKPTQASSGDEVAGLNERYSPWVYQIPEYIAGKFRRERKNLLEKAELEKAPGTTAS